MAGLKKLISGIKPHRTSDANTFEPPGPSIWKRTGAKLHKQSVSALSIDPLLNDGRLQTKDRILASTQRVSAEEYFLAEYEQSAVRLNGSLLALAQSTLRLETQMQRRMTTSASPIHLASSSQQHIEVKISGADVVSKIDNAMKTLQRRLHQVGDHYSADRLADIAARVVADNSPLRSSFLEYLQSAAYREGWDLPSAEHFSQTIAWLFREVERLVREDFSSRQLSTASSYATASETMPRIETNPFRAAIEERKTWEAAYEPMREWSHAPIDHGSKVTYHGAGQARHRKESNPYRNGQTRVYPTIRDIDWSKVPDDKVAALVGAVTSPSSRVDSGISLDGEPIIGAPATTTDKGKGRATDADCSEASHWDRMASPSRSSGRAARPMNLLSSEEARYGLPASLPESKMYISRLAEALEDLRLAREWDAQEERTRQRECAVCGDEKSTLTFPAKAVTTDCEHPAQTCTECLQSWMASEFDTKGTEGIKCPECTAVLGYTDVQRAASKHTFAAYDKRCTLNALSSLPEFAWCLSPSCGSGQLNIENANFMDCMSCGYKQCLRHRTPWHVGEKCDEYDYRTSGKKAKDEERATEAMLNTVSKLCPGKKCGWRIEKSVGCDHMTCRKCRHEFCWQCLAPQKEIKRVGNTAHATTCKFHSSNLDVAWPFNMH